MNETTNYIYINTIQFHLRVQIDLKKINVK